MMMIMMGKGAYPQTGKDCPPSAASFSSASTSSSSSSHPYHSMNFGCDLTDDK